MRKNHYPFHLWIACALSLGTVGASTQARAGTFAADGSFVFDPSAIYTEGFEAFAVDPDAGSASLEIVDGDDALEGRKFLRAQTGYQGVILPVTLLATQDVYKVSAWLRGNAAVSIAVVYADQAAGDFAMLFPTGRVTSDDWIEFESAPFEVDGPRGATVALTLRGTFDADGIELKSTKDKLFRGPTVCQSIADPVCGPEAMCSGGWCRNASGWVPSVPDGTQRVELSQYLQNRLQFFFGPYANRAHNLPSAIAELKGASTVSSRWQFWNGFATAVRRLHDWHSNTVGLSASATRVRKTLNLCFFEGDADMSHGQAPSHPTLPDVLVAYTGDTTHTLGLKQGDRLVAVDGKHPIDWMQTLVEYDWTYQAANDPNSLAEFAQRLRNSLTRFAHTITVIKCTPTSCGAPEDIEVSTLPQDPPGTHVDSIGCDHRPTYIVDKGPLTHNVGYSALGGQVVGTQPEEKIYGMVWDYLLGQGKNDSDIKAQVASWADARGVLLDHRSGYGGTIEGPEPIINYVRNPQPMLVDLWRTYPDDEGPKDLTDGLALFQKYKSQAWKPGSLQAKTDVPVALMITLDGSASDYFPFAMKGAPKVRIFGPHATAGAFSSFMGMTYWNSIGYQIACEDTIAADGRALSAHGVEPDEVVWPKQSDLVVGKDTLAERALSWVRSELKP